MNMNSERVSGKTKVKKTARSMRIWGEGNKLIHAGFVPEAKYSIEVSKQPFGRKRILLRLDENGDRQVTKANRKGKARPIIDLHSNQVAELFDAGTELMVSYCPWGVIVFEGEGRDVCLRSWQRDALRYMQAKSEEQS